MDPYGLDDGYLRGDLKDSSVFKLSETKNSGRFAGQIDEALRQQSLKTQKEVKFIQINEEPSDASQQMQTLNQESAGAQAEFPPLSETVHSPSMNKNFSIGSQSVAKQPSQTQSL